MLEDMYGKPIKNVDGRYQAKYQKQKAKMTKEEFENAMNYICSLVQSNSSEEFFNPGWAAGSDWTDTPLQPIYEKACDSVFQEASFMYGLMVKEAFMDWIDEEWIQIKQEQQGRDFEQNLYMKKKK